MKIWTWLALGVTHAGALLAGIALGIYLLPILTAPEGPSAGEVRSAEESAVHSGVFRRDLADSDALHWGEGTVYVGPDVIALQGSLAPGPDYRLYLSPEFVETEADFLAKKSSMTQVGHVNTFENFMVAVPEGINPTDYKAVIIWCEAFGQFITAAAYQ